MYKCGWQGCEKAYGTLNHLNAHVTMQSHGQKRTPEGQSTIFLFLIVAKSRFWLDRKKSPGIGSAFTSQVTQHQPYRWCHRHVACSLMLPIGKIWFRLTSMSLAPANAFLQNSRKSERSGSNVRKKKTTSAKLRKREPAQPTEAANHRPTLTNPPADRTTPLDQAGPNFLRLDTRQPVVKFQPAIIQVGSTRCTRLKEMARYTRSTRTRPTAKGNKCMKYPPPRVIGRVADLHRRN